MELKFFGTTFAEIDSHKGIRLRGWPSAGAYGIEIILSIHTQVRTEEEAVEVSTITGRLKTESRELAYLASKGNNLLGTHTSGWTGEAHLGATLDLRQMTALNAERETNGDVMLYLFLEGIAAGRKGTCGFNCQDWFTVPQADWLQALSHSGFGTTLLSEVVVLRETADPKMATAVEALNQGLAKLRQAGGENDAVASCRLALEAAQLGDWPKDISLTCAKGRSHKDLSLDERLAVLRSATKLVTQLPHHDVQVRYSQGQANALLQVTAALLALDAKSGR